MTEFKKILFGFFGLCILAASPLAYAQDTSGTDASPQQWHPGQRIQEIYNQLGLTDDQKKQLEANKQQHRVRMENARQEMKTNRQALQKELMKPDLDTARIKAVDDQIKALQSQMEDERLSSILAARAILTPEQFLKFTDLMHRHKRE